MIAAQASEQKASMSEANAKASEQASKLSETNAKKSEESSASSASVATGQASSARTSASNASISEANSKASEKAASISETNAKSSSDTATKQASSATDSAKSAGESAASAKSSATSAASSATAASNSVSEASTSAANAKSSETLASGYKTDSANSAASASSSASSANTSATNARAAMNTANTAASSASSSASSASTSASNASKSEVAAKTAQAEAEKARDDANSALAKISGALKYMGQVDNYRDLPTTGNTTGDTWNIVNADVSHNIKAGDNVAWNGTDWDDLSGVVDLLAYAEKADYQKTITSATANGATIIFNHKDGTTSSTTVNNVASATAATNDAKGQKIDTTYEKVTDASNVHTSLQNSINNLSTSKQDKLTFDSTPTANSSNPVTSSGIKTALDGKPSNTGAGATGTWPISVSGNAKTANKANTIVSMPATETSTTESPVWLSWEGDTTKQTVSSKFTYNCSTKTLTANNFKGNLVGNADTATKAVQDGTGNVITDTYETKSSHSSDINSINNTINTKCISSLTVVDSQITATTVGGTSTAITVNNVAHAGKASQDDKGQAIDVAALKSLITTTVTDAVLQCKKDLYPVGSVYVSISDSRNPADILGFGTWEALPAGYGLVAQGTATAEDGSTLTFTAREKSGEFKHQLTVGELATHNHRSYANCAIWADKNAWNDSLTTSQIALDGSETNSGCVFMDRTVESAGFWYSKNTGGNTRHNNVSPCLGAYLWRRTA